VDQDRMNPQTVFYNHSILKERLQVSPEGKGRKLVLGARPIAGEAAGGSRGIRS